MSWIESALTRVEAGLRAIFEGSPDDLPRKFRNQLSGALDSAMREGMITLNERAGADPFTHFAPDQYTLILPDIQARMLQAHPSALDRLAEKLARDASQAHIQLSALPILRVVASPHGETLHVQADFSHTSLDDSSTTELEMPAMNRGIAGVTSLNAFLIVNGLNTYPITAAVVNIGSDTTNQLVLGEASVAPRHAQLRLVNQRHIIFDLGTQGGTRVNDMAVSSYVLSPGDVIRLGNLPLVYGVEAAAHVEHTQKIEGNHGPVEII